MRSLFLVLGLLPGCTLLFDPSGLVPHDASVDAPLEEQDLPASVDDLRALEDLSSPDLTPLADLSSRDLRYLDLRPCTPPTFVGFYDGGSPDPLDCNTCGCQLDPMNDPASWPLKFNHVTPALGWSETFDPSGVTLSAPSAAANDDDYFQSLNHFYLDGDFDLELDYQLQSVPQVAYLQLVIVGPPVDLGGSALPVGVAQTYFTSNGFHIQLVTDDRSLDVQTSAVSGTLRLRRKNGALCASTVGSDESCHQGTGGGRVWLQVSTPIACAAGCSMTGCCNYRVHVANLRMLHGAVVSKP